MASLPPWHKRRFVVIDDQHHPLTCPSIFISLKRTREKERKRERKKRVRI